MYFRFVYYGKGFKMSGNPKPGERKRQLLKTHSCHDSNVYCQSCCSNHKSSDLCSMRFRALKPENKKPRLCFVSYAAISSDIKMDCYQCYKSQSFCELHGLLENQTDLDFCNSLVTLERVS